MLRWTSAGAVAHPTTLQIRIRRHYPERVPVGAPVPSRSLSIEEFESNVRYFTEGMRGPRTRPAHELILSGVSSEPLPEILRTLDTARVLGMTYRVCHLGALLPAHAAMLSGHAERVVIPILATRAAVHAALPLLHALRAAHLPISLSLRLQKLEGLSATIAPLADIEGLDITFSFPFPTQSTQQLPHPQAARAVLSAALAQLERPGRRLQIKGLAACHLGALAGWHQKTRNRWYVDADHQRTEALLFFPDVVSFFKSDQCRFCALDTRCDGSFAQYQAAPGYPPLRPQDPP